MLISSLFDRSIGIVNEIGIAVCPIYMNLPRALFPCRVISKWITALAFALREAKTQVSFFKLFSNCSLTVSVKL